MLGEVGFLSESQWLKALLRDSLLWNVLDSPGE